MNKEEQGRQTTMAHATVCSSQRAPNGVELPSSCQVFFFMSCFRGVGNWCDFVGSSCCSSTPVTALYIISYHLRADSAISNVLRCERIHCVIILLRADPQHLYSCRFWTDWATTFGSLQTRQAKRCSFALNLGKLTNKASKENSYCLALPIKKWSFSRDVSPPAWPNSLFISSTNKLTSLLSTVCLSEARVWCSFFLQA